MKYKKIKKGAGKMLNLGMGTYMGATVMGAMPSMGAGTDAIKTNVVGGYSNFSSAFPTVGKLAGAGMVVGSAKQLTGVLGSKKKKR